MTRLDRARAELAAEGVGGLVVGAGPDLAYLTGYHAMPLERLTALVLTPSTAALVVPRLEAPRVEASPDLELVVWEETEDPLRLVADRLGGARRVAVDGRLRATFLLGLQERLSGVEWLVADGLLGPLRLRKDPTELELLARASAAADRVIPALAELRMSGRTEREIARIVADLLVEAGHDTVEFVIVAAGPNAASPHHEPTDRVVEVGDTVVVDFGGSIDGYHSDTTRTFVVGPPDPEIAAAHAALRAAQEAAVDAVAPGVPAASIDAVARDLLTRAGYGEEFVHRTGHGIGLEVHEPPYLVAGNATPLEPGMVFSVEPGIYRAGRWGMRIEDIVAVDETGAVRLNRTDRRLYVVD